MCMVLMVLPPLDVRFGWSLVPWYISLMGDVMVAFSFYIFHLVSKENTYAAANVRVEEGQKVISDGLYGVVRHPMYFGALFLFIGTPLALGSWWTLLLIPIFLVILIARILNEEKILARDLPGYTEYQKKSGPALFLLFGSPFSLLDKSVKADYANLKYCAGRGHNGTRHSG